MKCQDVKPYIEMSNTRQSLIPVYRKYHAYSIFFLTSTMILISSSHKIDIVDLNFPFGFMRKLKIILYISSYVSWSISTNKYQTNSRGWIVSIITIFCILLYD